MSLVSRGKPQILRTDMHEIRIWPRVQQISFHKLDRIAGETVPRKASSFTLRGKEFLYWRDSLKILVENMTTWMK